MSRIKLICNYNYHQFIGWSLYEKAVVNLGHISNVCFQVSPQIAYPVGCVVTLVAFVRLFSTVRFQMSHQITCL